MLARSHRATAASAVALAMLLTAAACATYPPRVVNGPPGSARKTVVAFVPYWDQPRAFVDALAHTDVITDVSPWWYTVRAGGAVDTRWANAKYVDLTSVRALQARGVRVTPVVATSSAEYQNLAPLLHDPTQMAAHVQNIVDLVIANGYDGIDIDYEELKSTDRAGFSAFMQNLAAALHARKKFVAVDVFAKATDAGYDDRNLSQDYAALGRAVDQVRLMAYDWHWGTSAAGSIAPVSWVDQVAAYATTQIPVDKIVVLSGLFGYDWVGANGTSLTWDQVDAIVNFTRASVVFDNVSATPHFTYMSGTTRHDVWFEDAQSLSSKLAVARQHSVGGVGMWRLGGEDPQIWARLANEWVK